MRRNSRNIMALGALGAMAGLMLIPAISSKNRRKMMRAGRNAYFRASDLLNDIRDMRK